jgi:thioredoxin reductase (NADPH)
MCDIKKDVVIIGAGPAGLATAIQLNRYKISCVIVEKNSIGGLLKNANKVENYLGFPEGKSGTELVELFTKQINKNKIQIIFEETTDVDYQNGKFLITTKNAKLESEIVVIASGTKPKQIKNLIFDKKIQNKIFDEVYKIKDIKSKDIAIIGSGDAAFDYALHLAGKNNVTIFNRKYKTKCLTLLRKRVEKNKSIRYKTNYKFEKVELLENRLKLNFSHLGRANSYLFDFLLLAIGREPELSFFGKEMMQRINLLINDKKLFLIGDVKNRHYRQLSIASGDGIRTAMEINEVLDRTKIESN